MSANPKRRVHADTDRAMAQALAERGSRAATEIGIARLLAGTFYEAELSQLALTLTTEGARP